MNVEAIVVRQAFAASAFDPFVTSKAFRAREWTGLAPPEDKALPPALSPVPLSWAVLDRVRVTVALGSASLNDLRFTLVERDRTLVLDLDTSAVGEWTGLLDAEPDGVAAIRVDAADHAPAFAFVSQDATLRIQPRLGRIKRAVARVGRVALSAEERSDLLASIADLVEAVGAAVPNAGGVEHEQERRRDNPVVAPLTGTDDPIRFVDDAVVQPSPGALIPKSGLRRLWQILDAAILGLKERPDDQQRANRWRPPAEGVEGEPAGDPEGDNDAPPPDDDEARVDDALAIADVAARVLSPLLERSRERAVVVYEVALRALVNATRAANVRAAEVARRAVSWIASAWAVESWPDEAQGWALKEEPRPEAPESERGLLEVLEKALFAGPDAEPLLDAARLAYLGITRDGEGAALEPHLQPLRESLERRRNLSEQAEAIVAPLLSLDRAAALRARSREQVRALEMRIQQLDELTARYGKRSSTYKNSAAELVHLQPELEMLREKARIAEDGFAELLRQMRTAATSAESGSNTLVERWNAARTTKEKRRVFVPTGKTCTACNKRLPTIVAQVLDDPRKVVACTCGVLLARGPRTIDG
jgi:hypothetical protein